MVLKQSIVALNVVMLTFTGIARADSTKLINPNNGHAYQRFDTLLDWTSAKNACSALGGYLTTITSQAENDWVFNNVGLSGITIWLGGTDELQEGIWTWVTGEPWSYTNWDPIAGEPNGGRGENYLSFNWHYASFWNDANGSAAYICEWDSNLISGSIGGSVTNTGLTTVVCKNVTTGQSLTIKKLKGSASWDCAAAGLLTRTGDTVKETLTGSVK